MPRRPRLRKPTLPRRTNQIKVLLSDDERDALQRIMTAEGRTAAELFRNWILSADETHASLKPLKRDPRDVFVRLGGFGPSWGDQRYVTFRPHDADKHLQGNGDPLPNYAVKRR